MGLIHSAALIARALVRDPAFNELMIFVLFAAVVLLLNWPKEKQ